MEPLARSLHQLGFTVSAPLLAGHGDTNVKLAATGWPDWYATARTHFLELRAAHQRVCLVGLSLGGLLSLRLAEEFPDKVSALATLAAPLFLGVWARFAVPLVWYSPLRFFYRYQKKVDGGDIKDEIVKKQLWSNDAMPVAGIHSLMQFQKIVRQDLRKVSAPTLVVHARDDHTAPYANLQAIAEGIGATVVETCTLTNSYHLITLDLERVQVVSRVIGFLQRFAGDAV